MPSLASLIAAQGLPSELVVYLDSMGVHTAEAFLKLQAWQGGRWRPERIGERHGRLLSSSNEQKAARVFLYSDSSGVFIPEFGALYRGPPLKDGKVHLPRDADHQDTVYPNYSFDSALMAVFYDELRGANVTSRQEADLFVSLNTVAAPPLRAVNVSLNRQAVTAWLEARNLSFGLDDTAGKHLQRLEPLRVRALQLGCDTSPLMATQRRPKDELRRSLYCVVRRQLVSEMCERAGPSGAQALFHLSAATLHRHFGRTLASRTIHCNCLRVALTAPPLPRRWRSPAVAHTLALLSLLPPPLSITIFS